MVDLDCFIVFHLLTGVPQALEITENLKNHLKNVPCIEKSWNLKKKKLNNHEKNHGILWNNLTKPPVARKLAVGHLCMQENFACFIENTRWVSFDIKFTRQGFENACWHQEVCQAIQHAFSKPSLVNLKSKDTNLVFYLSVYPLFHSSN